MFSKDAHPPAFGPDVLGRFRHCRSVQDLDGSNRLEKLCTAITSDAEHHNCSSLISEFGVCALNMDMVRLRCVTPCVYGRWEKNQGGNGERNPENRDSPARPQPKPRATRLAIKLYPQLLHWLPQTPTSKGLGGRVNKIMLRSLHVAAKPPRLWRPPCVFSKDALLHPGEEARLGNEVLFFVSVIEGVKEMTQREWEE